MTAPNPAPEATNPTEAPVEAPSLEALQEQLAALTSKYERAQRDLTKFRTRAEEVEQARAAAEAESLKQKSLEEQLAAYQQQAREATQRLEAAELARVTAERRAHLTGKVKSVDAALKLLEDKHIRDDGIDVDAFLRDYDFLKADTKPSAAAPEGEPAGSARALKPDDFRGRDPDWVMKNLHRLKK